VRTEMFNSPPLGLSVFREEDGSLGWKGTYKGLPIKDALPVDDECIILLDPDASKQPSFKNLFRVGHDGDAKWFADLPTSPDAFIDMCSEKDRLVARSWSGYRVRIDLKSGRTIAQEFVK